MRYVLMVAVLWMVYASSPLFAQNIGLGKSNPALRLDVNGGIIADSIVVLSGFSGSTPLKVMAIEEVTDQSLTNVGSVVTNLTIGAWQSFTAGVSGKLININLTMANVTEPQLKTLTIYSGEGITGNVLAQVQWTVPETGLGQLAVSTPVLNLQVTAGSKYTIHLDNFSSWAFNASNGYVNGISSFGEFVDFGFTTQMEAGLTEVLKVTKENGVFVNKFTVGNGSSFSKIQQGSVTVGNQPVAVSTKQITITFPTPFASTPKVFTSIQNEVEGTVNDYVVTIKSISTTQAIVSVRRLDILNVGWSENPKLFWTAFE